ncbi:MAG TPA: SDR family NAD(P)-dependent oxidoreductase [Pseudonocardiaceae bacterium]|nr:SDR family NAD(P)-dependent oxidoreductase [Pseudonocardiaceae bacterium]
MPALDGRVAVVTGGTRGIGLATCRVLADAGATVVLTGRDAKVATSCAKELAAEFGGRVAGRVLDVTDPDAVGRVIRGVARDHGRLDIAVANAGVLGDALLGMITDDLVTRMLSTNVAGTIHTVQAAARAMMRRGGSIIVLASVVGERGSAGQTAYAASKAAVANVARSAAKELGRYGIRVNAVAPGVIETDMTAHLPADVLARRVADTPLGRLGTPVDVARVIRFLADDDAGFVTGQVVGVDGGLVL